MQFLNLNINGIISFSLDGSEGIIDTSNPGLSDADVNLFLSEIENLKAGGFHELHLEKSSTRAFVHKVGADENFVSENNPEDYEIFTSMNQWVTAVFSVLNSTLDTPAQE